MPSNAEWQKLNQFLLTCGAVDDPGDFCVRVMNELHRIVPFDQGRVYFVDEAGTIRDEYLMGVSKRTTRAYHMRYADEDGGLYDAVRLAEAARQRNLSGDVGRNHALLHQRLVAVDWSQEPHDTRFWREHLEPQGIRFSTGFYLSDARGRPRVLYCLDRTRGAEFSFSEQRLLEIAIGHLENLYRRYFIGGVGSYADGVALLAEAPALSPRELEIASLLLTGNSTKAISERLGIATATVYKHLERMHRKLGVSNRTQLIARLSELRDAGSLGSASGA